MKCVSCNANFESNRKRVAGDRLWKLFLSAGSLKRINTDDLGSNDCRMKHLSLLKKTGVDFDHIDSHSKLSNNIIENVNFS